MSNSMDTGDLSAKVVALKRELGPKVVIPAHHYQPPEVVSTSDFIGDSYKLAVMASKTEAEYILLCGVRFMAESAAILAKPGQTTLTPDPVSGCPMADMIDELSFKVQITKLEKIAGKPVVPVTYMNSYADVKAMTGEHGGAICTSSNAAKIVKHYIDNEQPVFFSPDYNLGINTVEKLGLPQDRIFAVDKSGALKGSGDPEKGLMFIWDGYCHVHKLFTVADIDRTRREHEGIRVIVHPECNREVVGHADAQGSTEGMYKMLKEAPSGSVWAVGTEINFVRRAALDFPDKVIVPLRESLCFNMARINLEKVLHSLESIQAHIQNRDAPLHYKISVDGRGRANAEKALRKMIELAEL